MVVAAYVAAIFATIPFAPRLWISLSRVTGIELEPLALSILFAAGASIAVPALMRPRAAAVLAVAVVLMLYTAVNQLPFEAPAERIHFLEYGLVPVLIAWAQDRRRAIGLRLLLGAVGGAAIGVVDELVQAITPGRIAQWTDVALNAASASLGAFACWILVRSYSRA